MARLLFPHANECFSELRAVSYYSETDLEDNIRNHVQELFPDFHTIRFKQSVKAKSSPLAKARKPDLALIRRDFKEWMIVEVELEKHSINHILEQIRVFLDGDYNIDGVSRYLTEQLEAIKVKVPQKQISEMIDQNSPRVIVIADEFPGNWIEQLEKENIIVCTFETYKSTKGKFIYRAHGEYPVHMSKSAHFVPYKALANTYKIVGTNSLLSNDTGEIDILFDGRMTHWAHWKEKGHQYVKCLASLNPLDATKSYEISIDSRSQLYLKRN